MAVEDKGTHNTWRRWASTIPTHPWRVCFIHLLQALLATFWEMSYWAVRFPGFRNILKIYTQHKTIQGSQVSLGTSHICHLLKLYLMMTSQNLIWGQWCIPSKTVYPLGQIYFAGYWAQDAWFWSIESFLQAMDYYGFSTSWQSSCFAKCSMDAWCQQESVLSFAEL